MRTARLIPWAACLVGALIFHRYTLASGFDTVQADNGDSRYIAFMLEHWNAVVHGTARIGSPLIFFPVLGTLGYSDALAGMGAVHVLLRALGVPVFTAMNVQLVLWSLASFWAAYLFLARGFRTGVLGATVGAYFFAYSWPRFAALVHPQLQFTFVLPLMALLALECLRDGAGLSRWAFAWRLLALVGLLGLTTLTAVYFAEFFLLFLTVTSVPTLFFRGARQAYGRISVRQWPALLAAAGLVAVMAWPVARIYLPVMQQSGGRAWDVVERQLLEPVDLLWMGRENLVWGWLFGRWVELSKLKWPDTRLGVGLVGSLAWIWACVYAIRSLVVRRCWTRDGAIAGAVILGAAAVQLSAVRFGSHTAWWLLYQGFPGMSGIRAIGRIQLVAGLPMALGFALLVERLVRAAPRRAWVLGVVLGLAAIEQTGFVQRYSARDAEAVSRRVTDAIPPGCRSAYVMGALTMFPEPPKIDDPAKFDAGAYLAANPDVASAWKDTPWEHYRRFGRAEHRSLDPLVARNHIAMTFFYNYTIPLGATLAGIPVANGLSGWQPPGWDLGDVFAPDAPQKLAAWLALSHRDPADTCLVRIDMPYNSLPTTELWND